MGSIIAVTKKEKYKTIVQSLTNSIIVDEPLDSGGKDAGLMPSDLLSGSLASCTSITLRMYADRKEWEVEEISVDVSLDDDKNNPKLTRIVEVKGKLDESQRSRLLAIANACPMHKLLSRGIEIETKLKNEESGGATNKQ